jgi:hypothetical protein
MQKSLGWSPAHTHIYTHKRGKKKEVLFEELIIYTEISKESGREDY